WAYFTRVRGHVLRGLDLAQQLLRVAADAVVVNFDDLDQALWIDDEGAAQRDALCLDQHAEVARQHGGRIAHQGVLHLFDGVCGVVPRLVRKMRVRGHTVDFHPQLFAFAVVIGAVAALGRAGEGEIGRIEHDYGPLALERVVGHRHELAVVISGGLEGLYFGVDQGHGVEPRMDFDFGSHVSRTASIRELNNNDRFDRVRL